MKWNIGNIEIKNQVVLAPMAGVSNPSYMKICEEMGVGYAITELISAEAVVRDNKKTLEMLKGIDKLNIPVAVQIFGSNPETMAKASKILTDLYKIRMIDINMGCPVPKIALRAEAGSALLKNPKKIGEIVRSVVAAVSVPVTVKIRSGWDKEHINASEVAKICENNGASAIAIHARTRTDGYTGVSDWNIIKEVKKNVGIPVIGNGDVTDAYKAKEMLLYTGCDAVMIGRAALGNPWIFKSTLAYLENGTIPSSPSANERIEMLKKHYYLLKEDKNEHLALLEIRTHALAYLKSLPDNKIYKERLCKAKNEAEFLQILADYEEYLKEKTPQ